MVSSHFAHLSHAIRQYFSRLYTAFVLREPPLKVERHFVPHAPMEHLEGMFRTMHQYNIDTVIATGTNFKAFLLAVSAFLYLRFSHTSF